MITYVAQRLMQAVAVLLLASVVVFMLARVLPGDPARQILGEDASAAAVEMLREELGLNDPFWVQYRDWIVGAVHLDFGQSIRYRSPVISVISAAIPPTITLLLVASVVGALLGLLLGSLAGRARGRWPDVLISATTSTIIGVPSFWFGIMAILVFSLWLGWLPPGGWIPLSDDPGQFLAHLVMPALTMALLLASVLARFTRSSVVDSMASPYVLTARSKGISERRVLIRHGLRNALIPVLTVFGVQFARLLGGQVFVEQVFAIPGMGRLAVGGIAARDFPLIQGILIVMVFVFIVVNLVVDVLYGVVDPRVRPKGVE
jgi:peptide/nickel transport system permease protein